MSYNFIYILIGRDKHIKLDKNANERAYKSNAVYHILMSLNHSPSELCTKRFQSELTFLANNTRCGCRPPIPNTTVMFTASVNC